MKKRAVSSLLASLAVVSFILPALAADAPELEETSPVSVEETVEWAPFQVDGELRQSVEYENRNGVTYVTVSSFVSMLDPEAMVEEENGAVTVNAARVSQVEDGLGNTATVVEETLSLTVQAGASYIVANGRYLYAKDDLILLGDSVAAPVRLLARVFNLDVGYDGEAGTVVLNHIGEGAYLLPGDSYYNGDTLYWLSRIINAESGNQVLEGKIAVGNVVMNRVKDPRFPDTVYDVLFQKNQFTPVSTGSIYREPNWESVLAAKLVMDGAEVMPTALFFNGVGSRAFRGRTYVSTIGSHNFYK